MPGAWRTLRLRATLACCRARVLCSRAAQLIFAQIFDVSYGMFVYDEDSRLYWFNRSSLENEREFELIGIILGAAIYNGGTPPARRTSATSADDKVFCYADCVYSRSVYSRSVYSLGVCIGGGMGQEGEQMCTFSGTFLCNTLF